MPAPIGKRCNFAKCLFNHGLVSSECGNAWDMVVMAPALGAVPAVRGKCAGRVQDGSVLRRFVQLWFQAWDRYEFFGYLT